MTKQTDVTVQGIGRITHTLHVLCTKYAKKYACITQLRTNHAQITQKLREITWKLRRNYEKKITQKYAKNQQKLRVCVICVICIIMHTPLF